MREQTDKNGTWNKERKRINRTALISVLLAAVMIITFFAGYFVRGITEPVLGEIWKIIQGTSVYTKDMTEDELADLFVKATLQEDKYAKYYSPQEYKKILEEDKGRYSGVGVGITEDTDTGDVKVAKVYINSSAYKENVETGDVLVGGIKKGETEYTDFKVAVSEYNENKEEDEKITVLSAVNDFFADFDIGDEIKLKIQRGSSEPEEKTLNKKNYNVSYVEYKDNEKYYYFSTEASGVKPVEPRDPENVLSGLDTDTAYIKLYEFEGDAAAQFNKALEYMRTRGKTKLILDLRNNGGGLIDILLEIASYLINDKDAADIRVLNFRDKTSQSHYSTKNRFYKGENQLTDISVIANTKTASAAECLIGALLEYGDREAFNGAQFNYEKLILTEHNYERGYFCTYGKGIMQSTYPLKSGGALQLTTAYIYWPMSWVCIQDVGIRQTRPENCVADGDAIARANETLHPLP